MRAMFVPALSNLRDFFAEIGKKDVAESAGAIIEFLEERADMPLAAFNASHVVSASRRRNRTGAAHVDHALVADYLQRLDNALGKDDVFMALYRELQDDERVTKHEAVEIADRFMGPVAASTSRPKALGTHSLPSPQAHEFRGGLRVDRRSVPAA